MAVVCFGCMRGTIALIQKKIFCYIKLVIKQKLSLLNLILTQQPKYLSFVPLFRHYLDAKF